MIDDNTKETVVAVSDAAKEIASATTATMAVAEKAGGFLARVLGDSPENLVGIISDKIRFWRWERQLRLIDKVETIIKARSIAGSTRPVPPKFALPLIEQASLESEDSLQDLWVNLLANAMTPGLAEPKTSYIEILKQLDPIDVAVLSNIYLNYIRSVASGKIPESDSPTRLGFNGEDIMRYHGLNRGQFEAVIDNLLRVRCVTFLRLSGSDITIDGTPIFTDKGYDSICLTTLGKHFVSACQSG